MKSITLIPMALTLIATSTMSAAQTNEQITTVIPTLETRSHYSDAKGNFTDVDDPAIWVHPTDKSKSLVVTSLKKGGIDVYNLQGELLQFITPAPAPSCKSSVTECQNKAGRLNNAEIIYDFSLNGKNVDLAVFSDRGLDKLAIYTIDINADKLLTYVTAQTAPLIFTKNQQEINNGNTAYGLATAQTDKTMAFVSQNGETRVTQLEIFDNGNGTVTYKNIANLDFPEKFTLPDNSLWTPCSDDDGEHPHLEGMVADVENNALFLAQEDVGIWKVTLSDAANSQQWQLISMVNSYGVPYSRTWSDAEDEYICKLDTSKDKDYGNDHLVADAEGLTLYDGGEGRGYLLASSQGDNTIAIYNRTAPYEYINSFTVGDGDVDGVDETDGMMVVNANLGKEFSQGVLIMQDGDNKPPKTSPAQTSSHSDEQRESTNFKYVSWGDVAKALSLPVNTHFKRN